MVEVFPDLNSLGGDFDKSFVGSVVYFCELLVWFGVTPVTSFPASPVAAAGLPDDVDEGFVEVFVSFGLI